MSVGASSLAGPVRVALRLARVFAFAACTCATAAEVPRLELDVSLEPATRALRVVAEVEVGAGAVDIELHRSLEVGEARNGAQALAVRELRAAGENRVWRIANKAAGRLRIAYGGTLPALDASRDARALLQALPPMAGAGGSFLSAGSAWYPLPAQLFSYRVTLSLPGEQRGLVAGRLVSETLPAGAGERYRAVFEFERPADGIDLMAGPYRVDERLASQADGRPLRLRTYFFPALADRSPGYLEDSQRYLERYAREIGPYPFTEFSVVASPLPTGFGMPTLTYLGAEVLKLPFIRATSLGHEVLHNWWGNGVYPDYARGNWSEGLTTFMADYAYKADQSPEAAREMRLGWLRDFASIPAGAHQSLLDFRSRTHGAAAAVGYSKAAMVFLMLRDEIGEDPFLRGLRAFWQAQQFRVAGWDDLRRAFEQAAQRDLSAFFAQWLVRAGGPRVRIAKAVAQSGAGGARLALTIEQDAPAYALRVPVELVDGNRRVAISVVLTRERETVLLDLDALPQAVVLDPDLRLWRVLDPALLPPIFRHLALAKAPRLAVVSGALQEPAEALAKRFFEQPAQAVPAADAVTGTVPALLVGTHADVDAALAAAKLPARPENLAAQGTAQAWTVMRGGGAPLAVVSVRDAAALQALARPLPHYGAQSWVVFDGARALARGVWPAREERVAVER